MSFGLVQDSFTVKDGRIQRERKKLGFPWCKGENFSTGDEVCIFRSRTSKTMKKFKSKANCFCFMCSVQVCPVLLASPASAG